MHLSKPSVGTLFVGLCALLLSGAATAQALPDPISAPQVDASRERHWVNLDGEALPFTTAELEEFLRTAEIIERVSIDVGINGIDRLLLEKDGVRLRAGFRDVEIIRENQRIGREMYLVFRDNYAYECAAYELAKLLGIDSVPPAVLRRIGRTNGSVQAWVESDVDYLDDDFSPPGAAWSRQMSMMRFFDALTYNVDRNPGNLISDADFKLWLIDHTRAFQEKSGPFEVERVNAVERGVWERLQALDKTDFERTFSGLLESSQVNSFMQRRERLIEHINKLIVERGGEGSVIF